MSDWIVGLDDLPDFYDGFPLSAESLSRIGAVQDYLNERYKRVFPGQMIMQLETPAAVDAPDTTERSMYFVHLHRYLHWHFYHETVLTGRSFRMSISGKRAVEIDDSSSQDNSGVIDLTTDLDLDGNNYGLTANSAYEVKWETLAGTLSGVHGPVYAYNTYECATSNNSIALPYTNPTFGNGDQPVADDLTKIVENCNYLLTQNGIIHIPGYTYVNAQIPAPGGYAEHHLRIPHYLPYLVVRFDVDMGFYANVIDSWVDINGSTVYTDTKTKVSEGGGVIHKYELFLDASSLTVGNVYTVSIYSQKEQWDDLTQLIVHYVGESAVNTLPDW